MKHIVFPTVEQADAFARELKTQGLVREDHREHAYNRNAEVQGFAGRRVDNTQVVNDDHAAEEIGEEAVKGTAVGAVTGAAAALTGAALTGAATAATVATGGLAAPLIGLTLLGSGVGAAVGAAGEAAREANDDTYDAYDVHDEHYSAIDETYKSGGRAVAVDDNVPAGPLNEAIAKHGGRIVG